MQHSNELVTLFCALVILVMALGFVFDPRYLHGKAVRFLMKALWRWFILPIASLVRFGWASFRRYHRRHHSRPHPRPVRRRAHRRRRRH